MCQYKAIQISLKWHKWPSSGGLHSDRLMQYRGALNKDGHLYLSLKNALQYHYTASMFLPQEAGHITHSQSLRSFVIQALLDYKVMTGLLFTLIDGKV